MITGNPFVDTGLAVIASLAKLDSIDDLKTEHLVSVHKNGEFLAKSNSKIKSMSMIFTNNNILQNSAITDQEKRLLYYRKITSAILNQISDNDRDERCECCGNTKSLDIDRLIKNTLVPLGLTNKKRYVGRDWFPLAGSLTSDAQSLPSASRPLNLCARCLFAVHYLPLGVLLLNGKLTLFQSTSKDFWYEIIKSQVEDYYNRISIGNYETIGSKEGSIIAVDRLLSVMNKMRDELPIGISLFLWCFSNSGQGPDCKIEEIPNNALKFLFNAVRYGTRNELLELIKRDKKDNRFSLLSSISNSSDYSSLYPFKKYQGASQVLFSLYQIHIRNFDSKFLNLCYKISCFLKSKLNNKDYDRVGKDLDSDLGSQNIVRKYITEMTMETKLSQDEILQLFDFSRNVVIGKDLWKFIKYYMHHSSEDFFSIDSEKDDKDTSVLKNKKLNKDLTIWLANKIYAQYIEERGKERFINDILKNYRKIKSNWLHDQFVKLAERYENFNFDVWKHLCIKNNKESTYEILYLFRLLWTHWSNTDCYEKLPNRKFEVSSAYTDNRFDLDAEHENQIKQIVDDYMLKKNKLQFQNYILKGIRTNKIGINFIRKKLSLQNKEFFSDDTWDQFLSDKDGVRIVNMRLFQSSLLMANRLREKSF